jgi:nucleotide-binding universal stress UspA family protein
VYKPTLKMINILVPTDFSNLSKVAIKYAIRFANKIDANITLLHVVTHVDTPRAGLRLRFQSLEKELLKVTKEDLDALVEEFTPQVKTGHQLKAKIGRGSSFNEAVKKESKKLRSGLIIMGTRGASGLKKYIIGSNTASVIDVSHIPVLVIPELADFKNLRTVVYATDLKHIERELKILIPYVKEFDSVVHLIHVTTSLKQVTQLEKKIESFVAKTGMTNVVIRVMVNKNIDEAIDHYVKTTKADLLTTFTHEHSFYDKLFDRSITRKIAFQSRVPLLAFKQR